jgi:hypothetical protein
MMLRMEKNEPHCTLVMQIAAVFCAKRVLGSPVRLSLR